MVCEVSGEAQRQRDNRESRVSRLGPVTTRGKHPPADIKEAAAEHMASETGGKIPAERITALGDFVTNVYLPWIEEHKRPSTATGYRRIWEDYLRPRSADM